MRYSVALITTPSQCIKYKIRYCKTFRKQPRIIKQFKYSNLHNNDLLKLTECCFKYPKKSSEFKQFRRCDFVSMGARQRMKVQNERAHNNIVNRGNVPKSLVVFSLFICHYCLEIE